jgi:hypothetical protein
MTEGMVARVERERKEEGRRTAPESRRKNWVAIVDVKRKVISVFLLYQQYKYN